MNQIPIVSDVETKYPIVKLTRLTDEEIYLYSRKNRSVPTSNKISPAVTESCTEAVMEKEIYLHSRKNHSVSTSNKISPAVTVKREPEDTVGNWVENNLNHTVDHFENTEENNFTDMNFYIKTEPNLDIVKTEAPDSNENDITENVETTISNNSQNVSDRYECDECCEIFNSYEQFVVHKNLSHKNKPYVCQICNECFGLQVHFNLHVHGHLDYIHINQSSVKTSQTSDTNKVLSGNKLVKTAKSYNSNFNINETNVLSLAKCKPFKCPNCVFGTKSEEKFLNHQDVYHNNSASSSKTNNESFQCNLCIKSFINQTSLNGHMRYHSLRGEITPKRKSGATRPQLSRNLTKTHKCNQCSKAFLTSKNLYIHLSQHNKQMMCNICNKQFFLKKRYDKHLQSHNKVRITNNEQKFSNTFSACHSLDSQEPAREKIKCKFVPEILKLKNTTKIKNKHHLTQTNSFKCLLCNTFYASKKCLGQHNRQFHSDKKSTFHSTSPCVQCQWCPVFITKSNLFRHIRTFHPQAKPLKCSYCPMKFKDFPAKKLHMFHYHQN